MVFNFTKLRTQEGDSQRRIENTEDRVEEIRTYLNTSLVVPIPSTAGAAQYQAPLLNAAKDAFVYTHVLRTPYALQLLGALTSGQHLAYNGTDIVGAAAGTVPTATITSGSNTLSVNSVVGVNASTTQTLPLNPTAGDYIWIIRNDNQDFSSGNLILGRNTRNIEGAASNLTVTKNVTALFLWYVGATTGWRVGYVYPNTLTGTGTTLATTTGPLGTNSLATWDVNGNLIGTWGRSGNTTTLGSTSGALTSGNLVSFDVNGNLVDSTKAITALTKVISAFKTSDQTVTNSSSYTPITGFSCTLEANKKYAFKVYLSFRGTDVSKGFKLQKATGPTTSTKMNLWDSYFYGSTGDVPVNQVVNSGATGGFADYINIGLATLAATSDYVYIAEGTYQTNSDVTAITLQFAQNSAGAATSVIFQQGSYIRFEELA